MFKKSLILVLMLIGLTNYPVLSQTAMSDQQVVEYVKTATEAGKSQKQIMTELAARGVTRAQAERIKKRYEEQQAAGQEISAEVKNRQRRTVNREEVLVEGEMDMLKAEMSNPIEQNTNEAAL